ncbi:SDR family oxidoreductase [Streptomyces nojiriensis]|uniref:3-oxoacyl-ACP reductase n=1 Tax=Streptomyces nojiriensis TaxID=66374 RepID=A0ABQ3SX03_9ACTN|nr:SDR family oxidoreductase [Streptomyces nojiriensis]QTI46190.1 putative oxidoreductase YgfF [Streptomyces nojiriensis]GGR87349.1 3-oxoacyl-ACP reductase [Streptomyces nojiriensis]GHI72668.1 3-oxoacyl-ACP reductase [Streptomyces nojiriensis]
MSKNALVTGGSRGIGRAVAERLAADGVTVVLTYASDAAAARETVERITEDGGRAFALQAELGSPGSAAALWAAYDELGLDGVDIIVNNAGIGLPIPLGEITEQDFDRVFAVNVRAPFFVVQEALGRLRDGGRIINVSSGAARIAMPEILAYGATKGALDTLTLNLAKALGARGITVNSVAPGIVDTDVNAGWLRGNAEAEAHAASLSALGRVGRPDDIADVVGFLASDAARWVTGRVVDATGGSAL